MNAQLRFTVDRKRSSFFLACEQAFGRAGN